MTPQVREKLEAHLPELKTEFPDASEKFDDALHHGNHHYFEGFLKSHIFVTIALEDIVDAIDRGQSEELRRKAQRILRLKELHATLFPIGVTKK